jgi:hypothetical protein
MWDQTTRPCQSLLIEEVDVFVTLKRAVALVWRAMALRVAK